MSDVDDVEIGFEVQPEKLPRRRGRTSRFDEVFLKLAKNTQTRVDVLVDVDGKSRRAIVGPTARYPKSGKPEVGAGSISDLRKKWGKGSQWHQEHGYYFHVILADRVTVRTPAGNTPQKGVLYVTKVYETVDGEPTPEVTT